MRLPISLARRGCRVQHSYGGRPSLPLVFAWTLGAGACDDPDQRSAVGGGVVHELELGNEDGGGSRDVPNGRMGYRGVVWVGG